MTEEAERIRAREFWIDFRSKMTSPFKAAAIKVFGEFALLNFGGVYPLRALDAPGGGTKCPST
jgi:hypothetical protein